MRTYLAGGVYDVFPVVEPTKKSRFFLLNPCAQASHVQFKLRSPNVDTQLLPLLLLLLTLLLLYDISEWSH